MTLDFQIFVTVKERLLLLLYACFIGFPKGGGSPGLNVEELISKFEAHTYPCVGGNAGYLMCPRIWGDVGTLLLVTA